MSVIFEDSRLDPVREKVERSERLTLADGIALSCSSDLLAVGYLANLVRERLHGDLAYFEIVQRASLVRICQASGVPPPAVPRLGLAAVRELASRAGESVRELLGRLYGAGLDSLICEASELSAGDVDSAKLARDIRLPLIGTMQYGLGEGDQSPVEELIALREFQDKTDAIFAYSPTALDQAPETTGFLDLKMIAIGRLMLDNVAHIRTNVHTITPRIAQIALRFGADDLDGTTAPGNPVSGNPSQARAELLRLILKAGRKPVERDRAKNSVDEIEPAFPVLV